MKINSNSPFYGKFKLGDKIQKVNNLPIHNISQFVKVLKYAIPGEYSV